jgi:hypothetical protein
MRKQLLIIISVAVASFLIGTMVNAMALDAARGRTREMWIWQKSQIYQHGTETYNIFEVPKGQIYEVYVFGTGASDMLEVSLAPNILAMVEAQEGSGDFHQIAIQNYTFALGLPCLSSIMEEPDGSLREVLSLAPQGWTITNGEVIWNTTSEFFIRYREV